MVFITCPVMLPTQTLDLCGRVDNTMTVVTGVDTPRPEVVRRIQHLLYIAEYKRRQAAPGVKISRKIFGRDRRYPITNRFRDA